MAIDRIKRAGFDRAPPGGISSQEGISSQGISSQPAGISSQGVLSQPGISSQGGISSHRGRPKGDQPWVAAGMSRAAWYRLAKGG
jgi:hypothetical protein